MQTPKQKPTLTAVVAVRLWWAISREGELREGSGREGQGATLMWHRGTATRHLGSREFG